ncbi:MAG TPA: N-acetylglucosamine-6-phosphate deacetylase [Vicinamibacterales bacterium]|jgi:N-acetylglucosamine-6-phosphate deacetylase
MLVLSGADVILPDRILSPGTLVIDGGRIVEIRSGNSTAAAASPFAFHGHSIVPGFIDVHVHGVEGFDTLGAGEPIEEIARRLPRYGVTGFCPTTVASGPAALRHALEQVRKCRASAPANSARVLPAHLESNFISDAYRGAQPAACLRSPRNALGSHRGSDPASSPQPAALGPAGDATFTASEIIVEIERAAPDVGIVTLAPELDGAIELIEWLVSRGHRASLGHSGATYDQALAAIAAGARHATHLFNRMPPLHHRSPGLAGAILQSDEIAAEIICDGAHVHPALVRMAVAAKRPSRLFAITDGTALSALREGATAQLGDQTIVAGRSTALLPDGTLAGSVLTMDRAFQTLVRGVGLTLVDAAVMCATTPARELGLVGHGVIAADAVADLTVLDADLRVVQTYVAGRLVYASTN